MTDQTRPARQQEAPVNHLRSIAAAALTLLPPVAVAWTAHAWADRLPDPLPTHWSDLSTPDRFASYAGTWATVLVVALAGAALGLGAAVLSWLKPLYQRATAALGAAVAFGALGVWLATAQAAWDRDDAHGSPLGWGVALPVVASAVAVVAVLALIGRRPRTVHSMPATASPTSGLVLAPGETVVWAERRFVVWPLVVAAVLAVAAVVVGFTAPMGVTAILAASTIVAAVLAWVQVSVDERGLRVGLGPWAWTVKKVPLEAVAHATAEAIDPADWGGWGYRVMPGRSALVLGAGPAVVVDLTDGRRFAVSVDDPEVPAALLLALRDRRVAGVGTGA